MNWSTLGMFAAGGVYSIVVLLMGIGIGRQPFVTPKDPRELGS